MRRWMTLQALVLLLALVAVACGSSDEAEPESAQTTLAADDSSTTEAPTTDSESEVQTEADEADDEDTATAGDDTGELTATARGVTADTITLGVGVADVSLFAPTGVIVDRYQPLADATNAAGGINGRQVELVFETWDIIDQAASDTACVALTEDAEVFLVLGFMPGGFNSVPCYTEVHDTIIINSTTVEDEDIVPSEGRLLSTRSSDVELLLSGLSEIEAELAGAKVAVYGTSMDDNINTVADLLTDLGADVVEVTGQQVGGSEDLVAAEAEIDAHVLRWQASGAEWLINVDGSVAGSLAGLQRAGLTDMKIISSSNLSATLTALGADLTSFETLIATGPPNQDQLAVDDLFDINECIAIINDATGQGIAPFPPEGDDDQVATTVEVCAAWDMFVTLATEAGPNLTPDAFLQAGYDLGPFDMTGSPSGSISPSKAYASDADGDWFVYDAGSDTFVPR